MIEKETPIAILFVCLGNICRSPTAEAVFRARARKRGLAGRIRIDSAGTGDWHIGQPPDQRAQTTAIKRGYRLNDLRARQVSAKDFARFDYILAMDNANLADLRALDPGNSRAKVVRFLDIMEQGPDEVPDPYQGDTDSFARMLDLIEQACDRWLDRLAGRRNDGQ